MRAPRSPGGPCSIARPRRTAEGACVRSHERSRRPPERLRAIARASAPDRRTSRRAIARASAPDRRTSTRSEAPNVLGELPAGSWFSGDHHEHPSEPPSVSTETHGRPDRPGACTRSPRCLCAVACVRSHGRPPPTAGMHASDQPASRPIGPRSEAPSVGGGVRARSWWCVDHHDSPSESPNGTSGVRGCPGRTGARGCEGKGAAGGARGANITGGGHCARGVLR